MTGYGGTFAFDPQVHDLLDGLRSVIRRRARPTQVQFRCTIERAGRCSYTFVGDSVGLDLLLNRLRRDLPTAAEAMAVGRSAATRRRLANGLMDILVRQRLEFHDRLLEDHVPLLRGRSDPIPTAVFGLPAVAEPWLPRLWVTDHVLGSWLLGEVSAEVVIEELHTATDVLLRAVRPPEESPSPVEGDGRAGARLLSELTDVREPARRGGAEAWLAGNFWSAAHVLEQLSVAAYRELSSKAGAAPASIEAAVTDEDDDSLDLEWHAADQ